MAHDYTRDASKAGPQLFLSTPTAPLRDVPFHDGAHAVADMRPVHGAGPDIGEDDDVHRTSRGFAAGAAIGALAIVSALAAIAIGGPALWHVLARWWL